MLDPAAFRAEFPVLEKLAYLNAGTEGPMPARAAQAVRERVELELSAGRSGRTFFESLMEMAASLRAGYAAVLGAAQDDVALTGSTTDGVNTVISGLRLGPGDEVLTSDEEHPGLLVPLGLARRRQGISVRVVPFAQLTAEAVSARTRLIAASHVSWATGKVLDATGLAATGVPLLLDAAQGIGAIPVDVNALGCAFYAASGQKWLCGPEGSGCLYVNPERLESLTIPWGQYGSIEPGSAPLDAIAAQGAKRLDHGFPVGLRSTWALASLSLFEEAGWPAVHERAASLAQSLAERLTQAGLEVAPRGRSTLVSYRAEDPDAEVARLAAAGLVVRSIPGWGLVRTSVGAWTSEEELAALVRAAAER